MPKVAADKDLIGGKMNEIALNKQYFELKPTGLIINRKPTFDEWMQAGEVLRYIEGSFHWWLGDWLNYGEQTYGEMYSQVLGETGFALQTLTNDKYVASKIEISRRREILSWSHHCEVASLNIAEQDRLLDLAEQKSLSLRELRKQKTKALPTPPLPEGKYRVIYADPPWQYNNAGLYGAAEKHYATMSLDEICELKDANGRKITDIPAENSVLFLWVTSSFLQEGLEVCKKWGFDYKTNFVWLKDKKTYGKLGFYTYSQHEFLFVAVKGSCLPDGELTPSIITAPRRNHSRKPDIAYEIIEHMYEPDPNKPIHIELFARNARKGWDGWGIEYELQ